MNIEYIRKIENLKKGNYFVIHRENNSLVYQELNISKT